ncbi:major facilitator superfamily domain-containing protein [Pseudomassariella vexata]|uniref:Major facilitator superfamily domain-containing protein n=1 Tax=Pseudomassariella vexata TaxID=1141098 RepID=A0A1Y2DFS0_9PEZI|nr:major facilitator superfamily domain-containing protein [Pseudomassariella vexata]ORY58121.1 major facilitator superfamily domain-containing protein [Pseudomassariella vexata]
MVEPEKTHVLPLKDAKKLPELPPLDSPPEIGKSSADTTPTSSTQSPDRTSKPWTPVEKDQAIDIPQPSFSLSLKGTRPPRLVSKDVRPMTASTKRLSFSKLSSERTIKYGSGKHAHVELVPQPSEDATDPLNWPMWRKNLNFVALLYMVALVGVMKTIFISVNSTIAVTNNVSYTAVAALTAVPLMVSALAGVMSSIFAKVYGKRPMYLASTTLIFIGAVWNTSVMSSFGQNMAARVFQGLGWGAFDTLVLASLQDTFFDHERGSRIMIYYGVSVATTWGTPLLGGVASASSMGFSLQYDILNCFLVIGMLLVVFGAPETAFERQQLYKAQTPQQDFSQQGAWPTMTFTPAAAKAYLYKMKPWSYQVTSVNTGLLLQVPRAIAAPTTILLCIVTLLPYAGLWGLANSISLLFSIMPFMLPSNAIGTLLTGPFIMGTIVAVALVTPYFATRFTPKVHVTTLAAATGLASSALLTLGLYIEGCMMMPVSPDVSADAKPLSTMWSIGSSGSSMSFPFISLLLGLLAAGSLALDSTIRPMIQRSTAFTSSSLNVCLRNTADMHAAITCLRNFVAGALVVGLPSAVWAWDGLRSVCIGLGAAQVFVAAVVGVTWWGWEENVRRLDGRVMGLVDLKGLKKQGSFFNMD